MTEIFSPEYKAFILSDEAKVLQEHHKWQVGDWYTYRETGAGVWLYHEFNPPLRANTACLLGLTDLLDMIEEAGYWWSTGLDYDGDDRWYTVSAGNIEAGDRIENDHEDLILAAAKLAVRVLEEGKENVD